LGTAWGQLVRGWKTAAVLAVGGCVAFALSGFTQPGYSLWSGKAAGHCINGAFTSLTIWLSLHVANLQGKRMQALFIGAMHAVAGFFAEILMQTGSLIARDHFDKLAPLRAAAEGFAAGAASVAFGLDDDPIASSVAVGAVSFMTTFVDELSSGGSFADAAKKAGVHTIAHVLLRLIIKYRAIPHTELPEGVVLESVVEAITVGSVEGAITAIMRYF